MTSNRVRRLSFFAILTTAFGVICMVLAWAPKSSAIPAFSRKYQTSCTTCHSNYPELNDFGVVFKKNGFKFPKDDESFVKEPPVLLGAKAQKEAFPQAVYPGEIPGFVPIAFRYSGNFNWNAKQPAPVIASSGYTPRTDLFIPNTFTIISAGSFGQNLAFWVDDDISTGGTGAGGGMGDGYLRYNDLGHIFNLPKNALNVRVGQFELDLPFTQARSIYPSAYDIYTEPSVAALPGTTNNQFVLADPQRGIEFDGYPNNGNFTWSVALIDGTNNSYASSPLFTRNTKDVYVNVSKKINLERDLESRNAIQAAGPTGPRDHTSIQLDAFYYYGKNQLNLDGLAFPGLGIANEPFYRTGAAIRFKYRQKLELFGLGMYGHDENLEENAAATGFVPAKPVKFSGGFAGSNYWIFPWVIAYMRYDFVNSPTDFANGTPASQYTTRNRFSPGFQILVRANIKVIGEYEYRWGIPYPGTTPGSTLYFRPNSFVSGIDYVF